MPPQKQPSPTGLIRVKPKAVVRQLANHNIPWMLLTTVLIVAAFYVLSKRDRYAAQKADGLRELEAVRSSSFAVADRDFTLKLIETIGGDDAAAASSTDRQGRATEMYDSIFQRTSFSRSMFGAIAGVGLILSGLAGWLLDQSNLCLNGGIIATGIYCQWILFRLSRSLGLEQTRSEYALRQLLSLDPKSLRLWQCPIDASILEQIFVELLATPHDRQKICDAVLGSFRSALMRHAEFANAIATKTIPSMGMLGTVLGLIFSLVGIAAGVANAEDSQAIADSILPVIGSMGLAFTTTLTAMLLGSLILGTQAQECVNTIEHFFDQLDAQLTAFPFPDEPPNWDAEREED